MLKVPDLFLNTYRLTTTLSASEPGTVYCSVGSLSFFNEFSTYHGFIFYLLSLVFHSSWISSLLHHAPVNRGLPLFLFSFTYPHQL